MSEDNLENLPSIDDITGDNSELPSIDDFIVEEPITNRSNDPGKQGGFGSGEGQEEEEEELEEEVSVTNLTEVLRLISDVRRDIPNIPEIKTYDEELRLLSEQIIEVRKSIPEVPEPKSYDREVEVICEQIDFVKQHIADLPEVKYYDEQISDLEDRIDILKENIPEVPEPRLYDSEIAAICEQIDKVKAEIPNLPEWVNEESLPDLSWVGRTFSILDEDVVKVNDALHTVRDRLKCEVEQLTETISTKEFETGVEIKSVKENIKETEEGIKEDIKKLGDNIFEELKEAALQINSHHREFKDDDNKLKKYILGKYEVLKQNVNEQINEFNDKNVESQNVITGSLKEYFDTLKKEIAELPDATYYVESIDDLKKDLIKLNKSYSDNSINITELYRIVEDLQEQQTEIINDRPINPDPKLKQGKDPLTPTNQEFATLKDLASNYRLFVNRVEQQLYTIGGGGAGFIKDLADVNIDGLANNDTLVWNATTSEWDVGSVGAGGTWSSNAVGIHTTKSVGIGTTTANANYALYVDGDGFFTGSVTGLGTIHFNDVTHVDSTGISTFQDGINITSGGLGIGTTNRRHPLVIGNPGAAGTSMLVHGDARVTGILTVGESSVTIDGSTNQIIVGTSVTITNSSVTIGDNVTIDAGASGINSAPNVFYVAKDGDDKSNGTSIDNAFLTI